MQGGNPDYMKGMVEQKMLGRKTGKGFYLYPKDAKKGAPKQLNPEMLSLLESYRKSTGWVKGKDCSEEEIQWRCIGKFINEAAFCLQDGIIRSPVDGDIGAVFGIGFPPFFGGPFRLLDNKTGPCGGVQGFVDKMNKFAAEHGPQFEPAQILKDYAAADKKFHV